MKKTVIFFVLVVLGWNVASAQEKIEWLTFEQAAEMNAQKPKTILVDVYTDWCGWCKKMDKSTFTDKKVVAFINENFYAVKMNAENNDRKFKFKGREYTEQTMARTMRVSSYPNFVIMDAKMENITQLPGYREAGPFLEALTALYENFTQ